MNYNNFQVTVYGNVEPYNDVISRARVRIFYKGSNRNGSYITDEFATKLLQTLPYTPIKGIYSVNEEDFLDHGTASEQSKIYGIVPENANITWENFKDEDGVTRSYACSDILLFTALYGEAKQIVDKPQSMEIYPPSIQGQWEIIDGARYFKFVSGCFLGLQVLGENVTPCFEGAGFFSLCDSLQKLLNDAKNFSLTGGKTVEYKFKLSFGDIRDAVFNYLNPIITEGDDAGYRDYQYEIGDIYDDYAVVYAYKEKKHYRLYYTKAEDDAVIFGDMEEVKIIDVTLDEYNALMDFKTKNNDSFVEAAKVFDDLKAEQDGRALDKDTFEKEKSELNAANEKLTNENSDFGKKIEELNSSISTLNTEKEKYTADLASANDTNADLNKQIQTLSDYKHNIETNEKIALIDTYSDKLGEETLKDFKDKIDNFAFVDLEKELAFRWVKSGNAKFTQAQGIGYIPKTEDTKSGIEGILSRYKK